MSSLPLSASCIRAGRARTCRVRKAAADDSLSRHLKETSNALAPCSVVAPSVDGGI